MAFDLQIAMKYDHGDGFDGRPGFSRKKTLVFEASDVLSHEGAASLAQAIDEAVSPEFSGYIVRFRSNDQIDADALATFVQWIRGRRDEGVDVRLCAVDPRMHKLLEKTEEADSGLVPFAHANEDTARRVVDTR